VLLPERCAVCDERGRVVCDRCEPRLAAAPPLSVPLHLDALSALFTYDDTTRSLLTGLKNHHRRDAVAWLAERLATAVAPPGGVVTWAPTSDGRRRRRGFDQAELLARALARRWGVPARPLLRRLPGPPQSGRSAPERRTNPAFSARPPCPPRVVLVDDIATTGATMTAAARALRAAGARQVHAVVAARAPRPGRSIAVA
jgi:ComF family protein